MARYEVIQGIGSYDATYSYIEVRPPLPTELNNAFIRALDSYIVIDELDSPIDSTLFEVQHEEARFWPADSAHVLSTLLDVLNENEADVLVYPQISVDGELSLFEQQLVAQNA